MKIVSRDIYKDWYSQEYANGIKDSIFGKVRDEVFEFITYLESNSSIIELGCGDGRNIVELLKKGLSVTGVDLIDKEIIYNKLSNDCSEVVEYIQEDIKYLNISSTYTSLLCTEVLHMFSKDEIVAMLEKISLLVQDDGYLFVDILSDLSRKFTLSGESFRWDEEARLSVDDAKSILLNGLIGWDIIKVGYHYDKQSWPLGDASCLPIDSYTWEGVYVYLIAKKRS